MPQASHDKALLEIARCGPGRPLPAARVMVDDVLDALVRQPVLAVESTLERARHELAVRHEEAVLLGLRLEGESHRQPGAGYWRLDHVRCYAPALSIEEDRLTARKWIGLAARPKPVLRWSPA